MDTSNKEYRVPNDSHRVPPYKTREERCQEACKKCDKNGCLNCKEYGYPCLNCEKDCKNN